MARDPRSCAGTRRAAAAAPGCQHGLRGCDWLTRPWCFLPFRFSGLSYHLRGPDAASVEQARELASIRTGACCSEPAAASPNRGSPIVLWCYALIKRGVDLVVIFFHEVDIAGKLNGLRCLQRFVQLLQHLFLFSRWDCLVCGDVRNFLLDRSRRFGEGLGLGIDARHHHGDVPEHLVIVVEILEPVLLGDGVELGKNCRGQLVGRRRLDFVEDRRDILLCGNDALHLFVGQLDLPYLGACPDLRAGRAREIEKRRGQEHPNAQTLYHPLAPRLGCRTSPDVVLLAGGNDQIWTYGGRAKIAAFARFVLGKPARTLYIGVRACRPWVCRRAFVRFKENMSVGTYSFWASCGISL